jgi:hypothetical protein
MSKQLSFHVMTKERRCYLTATVDGLLRESPPAVQNIQTAQVSFAAR